MSNSSLIDCTILSPNHSGKRTHSIDRITPHCVVGQLDEYAIAKCFKTSSREASCNYGIGTNGKVVMCVEECNRSWCSSSKENDQRAVTIECASDKTHPYYMNDKVYQKLIDLCTDICIRNNKTKLLWFNDKTKTLNYTPNEDEMVLTVHRWFKNKACPGDWLYNRLGDLANEVTNRINTMYNVIGKKVDNEKSIYKVQVGAYLNKQNALNQKAKLEKEGYQTIIVEEKR